MATENEYWINLLKSKKEYIDSNSDKILIYNNTDLEIDYKDKNFIEIDDVNKFIKIKNIENLINYYIQRKRVDSFTCYNDTFEEIENCSLIKSIDNFDRITQHFVIGNINTSKTREIRYVDPEISFSEKGVRNKITGIFTDTRKIINNLFLIKSNEYAPKKQLKYNLFVKDLENDFIPFNKDYIFVFVNIEDKYKLIPIKKTDIIPNAPRSTPPDTPSTIQNTENIGGKRKSKKSRKTKRKKGRKSRKSKK